VDTTQKLPTVLSLCTGYGGIERGLDLAGVKHRVIAHVEIEAFAIANLVAKMEAGELDAAPVWSNLKTLPVDSFRDRVDILTGGYPCQPFSAAGKRLGKEDPRHLWPYICDIIRAVRPVRCFFENVEGHISLGLREVISDLESLGYTTAWGIFSAREVGAPHQRKRVYIMADSSDPRSSRTGIESQHSNEIVEPCDSNSKRESGEDLENSSSQRSRDTDGANSVAYTNSSGLGQGNKEDAREPSKQSDGHSLWPPEPRLGRVVDGCANRVDRIRLLGNGVVPQCASRAWAVLSE
jgi:DNA (cytosine-5)-methyltransferase 1